MFRYAEVLNSMEYEDDGIDEETAFSLFSLPCDLFLLCCTSFDQANNISHYQIPSRQHRYVVERLSANRVVEEIFDEWEGNRLRSFLSFHDWTAFDCAITNRKFRKIYLSYIANMPIAFPVKVASFETAWAWASFTTWMMTRQLRLVSIILSQSIVNQLQNDQIPLHYILRAAVNTPRKENTHLLNALIGNMVQLTHLDCTNNQRLTTSGLKSILKQCTKLNTLSLSQCKHINDSSMKRIEQYGKYIRKLDISKCSISPKTLISILPELQLLVSLNVSSCRFSLRSIGEILRLRSTLEEFHMNYLEHTYINKATEKYELDQLVSVFGEYDGKLIVLSMNGLKVLSDIQLASAVVGLPHLKKLCLESCSRLTNAAMWSLGQSCCDLVALDIRNCGGITDEGIEHIAKQLPKCEDLAIDGCYQLSSSSVLLLESLKNSGRYLHFTYSHCPRIDF